MCVKEETLERAVQWVMMGVGRALTGTPFPDPVAAERCTRAGGEAGAAVSSKAGEGVRGELPGGLVRWRACVCGGFVGACTDAYRTK